MCDCWLVSMTVLFGFYIYRLEPNHAWPEKYFEPMYFKNVMWNIWMFPERFLDRDIRIFSPCAACWSCRQGSLFVIFRSFSGQLRIRFFTITDWKLVTNQKSSSPQAFNSSLVRNVYIFGNHKFKFNFCLPSQTCNHLENAMYTSKHIFNKHEQFWAFQPKILFFHEGGWD